MDVQAIKTEEEIEIKEKKIPWKRIVIVAIVVAVLAALTGVAVYMYNNTVYRHCVTEAGTEVLP